MTLLGQLVLMGSQQAGLHQRHIQSSKYKEKLYLHLLLRFCSVPILQLHALQLTPQRLQGRSWQENAASG